MKKVLSTVLSLAILFSSTRGVTEVSSAQSANKQVSTATQIDVEMYAISIIKNQIESGKVDQGKIAIELPTELLATSLGAVSVKKLMGVLEKFQASGRDKLAAGSVIAILASGAITYTYFVKGSETLVKFYIAEYELSILKAALEAREANLQLLIESAASEEK